MNTKSFSTLLNPTWMLHKTAARFKGVPEARVPEGGGGLRLAEFLTKLSECQSQTAEQRVVQEELARLRMILTERQDTSALRDVLLTVAYCHLLGYPVTSFLPHVASLIQLAERTADKRAGYVLAALLLSGQNTLSLMLVNGMMKDLSSRNEIHVTLALTALTHLMDADIASVMTPIIAGLLTHPSEHVRKLAIIVLEQVDKCAPDQLLPYHDRILALLDDPEPNVVYAVLGILYRFIQRDRLTFQSISVQLAQMLRIIASGHLSEEYDYHGVPAPWFQMRILKCIAFLLYDHVNLSEQVLPDILFALERAQAGVDAAFALVYECIRTLTCLPLSSTLYVNSAARPFEAPVRFLRSRNANLRCLGLRMLKEIVKVDPGQAEEHQMLLVDCLDAVDINLRRLTLDLLYEVTTAHNVTIVVEKMLDSIKSCRMTYDESWHALLSERIVELALRFSPSADWFVTTILTLFQQNIHPKANIVLDETWEKLISFISYDTNLTNLVTGGTVRSCFADHLAKLLATLLDKTNTLEDNKHQPTLTTMSTQLLSLIIWGLGEYGHQAQHVSVWQLVDLFARLYEAVKHDQSIIIICQIVMSIGKLLARLEPIETSAVQDDSPAIITPDHIPENIRQILQDGSKSNSPELRTLCTIMNTLLDQPSHLAANLLVADINATDLAACLDTLKRSSETEAATPSKTTKHAFLSHPKYGHLLAAYCPDSVQVTTESSDNAKPSKSGLRVEAYDAPEPFTTRRTTRLANDTANVHEQTTSPALDAGDLTLLVEKTDGSSVDQVLQRSTTTTTSTSKRRTTRWTRQGYTAISNTTSRAQSPNPTATAASETTDTASQALAAALFSTPT